jgi:hypothetical protein
VRRGLSIAVRAAAACLLVTVIVSDVVADSACDAPTTGSVSEPMVRGAHPNRAGDICADVCVPDCYCCSRSVAAGPAFLPAEPQRLLPVDAPPAGHGSVGVRPVVDHPPLPST